MDPKSQAMAAVDVLTPLVNASDKVMLDIAQVGESSLNGATTHAD